MRIARTHPECLGGAVLESLDGRPRIRLEMNVEMPLHMKADGVSASGVRVRESVVLEIPTRFPWQSPRLLLREDFPRDMPHLMPFSVAPRPCLVDGDQDEFFLQFGLIEYGAFQLIEQLAVWLRKAAVGNLIDPAQGWEPMFRRDCRNVLEIDAATARSAVDRHGGWVVWQGTFFRRGRKEHTITVGAEAWISSKGKQTPLRHKAEDTTFTFRERSPDLAVGNTVVGVIWPDKNPDGTPRVTGIYLPETIETFRDLRSRAAEFGCGRGLDAFLANLERSFAGMHLSAPIPIGIVLCVRRPVHLIGIDSDIELLPYIVEIRGERARKSLFAQGESEPVGPALHYQSLAAPLLRSLSGSPSRPALAILGCGSVGSKLALHAARAGQEIVVLSDQALLRPHNMARHALGPRYVASNKAEALAEELAGYEVAPEVHCGNLSVDLQATEHRDRLLPKTAGAVLNSTASLSVREALAATTDRRLRARLFEAALFGRGLGAFLLVDGQDHNPNHCDLMAMMYVTIEGTRAGQLLLDPREGLSAIQIGQGCGSLSMTMDDARLSAMTACLSEEIGRVLDASTTQGLIVVGTTDDTSPSSTWTRTVVSPFDEIAIDGSDGWKLRLDRNVAGRIKAEAKAWPKVETGGVMIGLTSARLKTVTVVDLLEAPGDSRRTQSLFVLGTKGLQTAIRDRHERSGRTLFDVGTWHSHLSESGPSAIDWQTAADLAIERTPPSVLLIATPSRFYALVGAQ